MTASAVYKMFLGIFKNVANHLRMTGRARDATVLEAASIHWLRHSFGSHSVSSPDSGMTLPQLQKLLGHASIPTTGIYTDPAITELHDAAATFTRRRLAKRTPVL